MPSLPPRRGQRRSTDRRVSASQRGYDGRWRAARLHYLQRTENALCRLCEQTGQLTPAEVVDHILPHKGDIHRFWDESNWQPLCRSCHSLKTATEDGGFGNVPPARKS